MERITDRVVGVTMWLRRRNQLALLLLLLGATTAPAAETAQAHYGRCMALTSSNAAIALDDATNWAKAGGGAPADHCVALALVGLGRYGEAAQKLDDLARAKVTPGGLRAEIFGQAGNAWILAGNGQRAVASLQSALTLSANNADFYADLARAQAMIKNWNEVVLDLNAALAQRPKRADLLVLRASAQRALRHYVDALKDLNAALVLTPSNAAALLERGLLRRETGDLGGARVDLLAAQKNGSPAIKREAGDTLDLISQ